MNDAERVVERREVIDFRLLPVRPDCDEAELRLLLCRRGILYHALCGMPKPAAPCVQCVGCGERRQADGRKGKSRQSGRVDAFLPSNEADHQITNEHRRDKSMQSSNDDALVYLTENKSTYLMQ